MQQNEKRVIAYGSKTLSKSQRRYCTTYRELLAVVTIVKEFRHYLWGRHFIIRTDHSSLVWIKYFKEPEGMLARWLTVLDTYDYEIQFRQGAHHGNADAMSRLRPKVCKRDDCPDCVETKIIQGKQSASVKQQPLSPSSSEVTKQSLIVAPVQQNRNNQGTESAGGTLKNNQSAVGTDSHILNNQSTEVAAGDSGETNVSNVLQDSEILPNWLDVWSPQQIKEWQENDESLSRIILLKSQFQNKPP